LPLAGNERIDKDEERVIISSSGDVALRFRESSNCAGPGSQPEPFVHLIERDGFSVLSGYRLAPRAN